MKLAWSLLPCHPASLLPCLRASLPPCFPASLPRIRALLGPPRARKHKRAILADGLNSGNEVGSAFQWSFRARQLSGGRGICFSEKFKNTADPSSPLASGNDGLNSGNESGFAGRRRG